MSVMQLTKIGYSKTIDAQAKGYRLSITTVKFGDGTEYVPTENDTALHGNILWAGPIANCDAITGDNIDFLCICPENLGTTTIVIGEMGLYLDTGELYAICCFPYPFSKAPGVRFKTHAICASPYLSTANDFTLNWTMSLPRVNYYGELPNPERSGDNAYIVNHGFTSAGFIRPSMLTRYAVSSTGPLAWGLLNGSLYYKGAVNVKSSGSFELAGIPITNVPADVIDFAFVYVYAGTGRTQCRAVQYNPATFTFDTLYEDFSLTVASSNSPATSGALDTANSPATTIKVTNLDSTSQIMLWTAVRIEEGAGLVYQGRWNASLGYPTNPLRGQYWVIKQSGILNGVCYQVGDWITYNGNGIWDKVDNTELPYLLYRGEWDASTGTAPPQQPVSYYWENLRQGHYWRISVDGTISGMHCYVGDWLVWTGSSWDHRLSSNTLTAQKLYTPRKISLIGDATGEVLFDGTSDVNIATTISSAIHVASADTATTATHSISSDHATNAVTADTAMEATHALKANDSDSLGGFPASAFLAPYVHKPTLDIPRDIWIDLHSVFGITKSPSLVQFAITLEAEATGFIKVYYNSSDESNGGNPLYTTDGLANLIIAALGPGGNYATSDATGGRPIVCTAGKRYLKMNATGGLPKAVLVGYIP